jgi:hypothetical protein
MCGVPLFSGESVEAIKRLTVHVPQRVGDSRESGEAIQRLTVHVQGLLESKETHRP